MQRPRIPLLLGFVIIAALSFGVYAYVTAHGYSAFFALLDDPLGFSPKNDSSDEQRTADPDASPPVRERERVPSDNQRPPDPALYNPDGSLRAPIGGLYARSLYNPRIAVPPLDFFDDPQTRMQCHYDVRNLNSNDLYPPRNHSHCCVLMPTDDPGLAYKIIASGDEWCLLSPEEALRAIAHRYRTRPAQTVYFFQAKQASAWPDNMNQAYATVLSDGSVRIKERAGIER